MKNENEFDLNFFAINNINVKDIYICIHINIHINKKWIFTYNLKTYSISINTYNNICIYIHAYIYKCIELVHIYIYMYI
jgi:hypothetical protein